MKNIALRLVALVATAQTQDGFQRERDGTSDKAKDAFEGKAPPELKATKWLNTPKNEPLTWKGLKGKVVLLDLWAYW